jgi:hypothetical protein
MTDQDTEEMLTDVMAEREVQQVQTEEATTDSGNAQATTDSSQSSPKKSAATLLVGLALDRYQFGCTEDGQPFAIKEGGHVVRMLRGGKNSLRAELSQAYYWRYGTAAPQQALADALLVLEGEAMSRNPSQVHLRVAAAKGAIWYDLGDTAETVVKIDTTGWQTVTTNVPVLFQRTALTGAMSAPQHGGNLDLLWQQLNVAKEDRPLVLAWLVAAIATPNVAHAVLSLFGEQGTGKSTANKRLVQIVDPSPVPVRKPPRDAESWVTACQGSWVVGLDNLSTVPDWLSDSICRAATGEGDVRRALYTDGGLAVFAFRRCIILNGIDLGALRGDLVDRLIHVSLEVIPEDDRVKEEDLDERWQQAQPLIFGALLAEIADVIRLLPSLRLASKPRMADYAHVLAAVDQLHGTDGLTRYAMQAKTMAADSLSADPFLVVLTATKKLDFKGKASELLIKVTPDSDGWRPPKDWPKDPRTVTSLLKRNAPALRKAGWVVEDETDRDHFTIWTLRHPEIARNPPPRYPQDPQTAETAENQYRQSQDEEPSDGHHTCDACGDPITTGWTIHPDCAETLA